MSSVDPSEEMEVDEHTQTPRLYPDLTVMQRQHTQQTPPDGAAGSHPLYNSYSPRDQKTGLDHHTNPGSGDPQNTRGGDNDQDMIAGGGDAVYMNVDPVDLRTPLTGNPINDGDGGDHQNNHLTTSTSTVIVTQPGKVQGDFRSNPEALSFTNTPDMYTAGSEEAESDLVPPVATQDKNASGNAGTTGAVGPKPSAPPDSVVVNIRVEWTKMFPDKWKIHLEKGLQSWSNKLFDGTKETCNVLNLQLQHDPHQAVIEISPSKALDVIKKQKRTPITLKELKCSTIVHFLVDETKSLKEPLKSVPTVVEEKVPVPEVDMFFTAYMDLDKWPSNIQTELKRRFGNPEFGKNLSFSGPFHLIEKNYREVCGIVGGSETGMAAAAMKNDLSRAETPQHAEKSGAPPAFTIPLFQYLYFSRAFRNELSQYEKEFGVKIKADVSVSVTAVDQTRSSSVQEAAQRFIDFYHHSTQALQCVNIPQTQLESEIVKEAVHHIQSDQTKMMLNMSADQCLLFGPEPLISTVQKEINNQGAGAAGRTDGPSLKSRAQATSELGKVAKEKESVKSKHDDCPICMDKFTGKQKLKCGHEFCKECLEASVKRMGEICPVCKNVFGKLMGNQPERTKDSSEQSHRPFGYPSRGTTEIACSIPAGVQRVDSLLDAVTDLDKRPLNERSEAPPALTVPLSQYWYLSHAFRKELSQIEKEFGVKINAEVSVSVTAVDQIRGDSVNKATRRVTDLVQNSMKGLQCAKIPHTQVESEILKEVVRNIRMDRAKMMINVSADQCLLFGPEPVMSGVEEQMNLEPGVKLERSSVCSAPGKLETDRDLRKASGNARAK